DSWTTENLWLDPSVKGQPETRKRMVDFLNPFCEFLSPKITELKSQESQKYAFHNFQMPQVIFNQDACSDLQRLSRDTISNHWRKEIYHLDDEKLILGLSEAISHFLSQQNLMKSLLIGTWW
ncbi:hypothetical protein FD755_012704, partial [Muntiacus reevesi]